MKIGEFSSCPESVSVCCATMTRLVFCTLPEVSVASCTFTGGYEQFGDVFAAVGRWVEENGYGCAGPMFNIYHVSLYDTDNPKEFITEVCYPVEK